MVLEEAETSVNNTSWNEEIRLLGNAVLIALLQPNLVLDEEAMEIARMQKSLEVEPIMILEGQKIIDEGEIVTQEVYSILNELGLVNKSYAGSLVPFLGSISLVFITFLAVFFYLKTQLKKVLSDPVNSILIFILYLMQMGILVLMADLSSYYFIPVTLFAMLTSILIRSKIAVSLNIVLSISALFIFNGSTDFLVYTLITGTFSALLVQYTNKRSRIILVATALAFIHFGTYVASELFFGKVFTPELFREGINAAAIGAGTVVVVVGSLPMWEAVFGINTPYRLMELANPTNELMRRLMIETPGTYHHCLIVANLAETAAYDIYCNGSLARVGAYYHDIGKLANPLYYSENQFGENIHDKLDPEISAKMIIAHIKEGVDLARKHNVPEVIVDIIKQHHGTTLVKYFYMKSAKEKIGVETLESNFRYEGPIPQFKEAAIVMLADTIEAAVRSVVSAGKSINDVEEIIDRLIKDKLNDGQLDDCRLDLKELAVIKKAFLKIFNGMYHDRIAYPKDEDIEKTRKENQQKKINKN
ncbi:MAG: HD family phosphohydrolase, partial [Anaerotignaceae bacterium]